MPTNPDALTPTQLVGVMNEDAEAGTIVICTIAPGTGRMTIRPAKPEQLTVRDPDPALKKMYPPLRDEA